MGWLNNLFGRRGPTKPTIRRGTQRGVGHRGIGIGSGKNPNLSPANIAKWQTLTGEEIDKFIYDGEPLFVHSTNAKFAQYHIDVGKLMIEYKDGGKYLYSNVSEQEASDFVQSQSKGIWIWSNLRIRGTKNGHRKPFTKL